MLETNLQELPIFLNALGGLWADPTATTLIITSFFTSLISAAMGLGGGVILMAVMASFLPVAVLVPVHGLVQMASNAGRATVQRKFIVWPLLKWFILGGIIGPLVGGQMDLPCPILIYKG